MTYHRLIAAMKVLKEKSIAGLHDQIRKALSSRWAGSWQSAVFHEVAVGDISWSAKLSLTLSSSVESLRRQFRLMMCSFFGVAAVLMIQMIVGR